jgi:hypothetical protein
MAQKNKKSEEDNKSEKIVTQKTLSLKYKSAKYEDSGDSSKLEKSKSVSIKE